MLVAELIEDFRRQVDDQAEPYLWEEEEILDLLDEAEDDFCERTNALHDQETLTYAKDEAWLTLPGYILDIRSAYDAQGRLVQLCNRAPWEELIQPDDYGMQLRNRDWLLTTDTQVRAIVTDLRVNQVRLYPIPTVAGSLVLDVYRRPKTALSQRSALEISDRKQQRAILTKVCALAYGKQDAECFNPKLAQALEMEYLATCDELLRSARRRRRDNQSISYGGL